MAAGTMRPRPSCASSPRIPARGADPRELAATGPSTVSSPRGAGRIPSPRCTLRRTVVHSRPGAAVVVVAAAASPSPLLVGPFQEPVHICVGGAPSSRLPIAAATSSGVSASSLLGGFLPWNSSSALSPSSPTTRPMASVQFGYARLHVVPEPLPVEPCGEVERARCSLGRAAAVSPLCPPAAGGHSSIVSSPASPSGPAADRSPSGARYREPATAPRAERSRACRSARPVRRSCLSPPPGRPPAG